MLKRALYLSAYVSYSLGQLKIEGTFSIDIIIRVYKIQPNHIPSIITLDWLGSKGNSDINHPTSVNYY